MKFSHRHPRCLPGSSDRTQVEEEEAGVGLLGGFKAATKTKEVVDKEEEAVSEEVDEYKVVGPKVKVEIRVVVVREDTLTSKCSSLNTQINILPDNTNKGHHRIRTMTVSTAKIKGKGMEIRISTVATGMVDKDKEEIIMTSKDPKEARVGEANTEGTERQGNSKDALIRWMEVNAIYAIFRL